VIPNPNSVAKKKILTYLLLAFALSSIFYYLILRDPWSACPTYERKT
jgi:hypothetical protein